MCNPTILMVGSLIGTGLQAYGQYQNAQATKDAANYNASVAAAQAADAKTRGALDVVRNRMRTRALKGKQVAAMAANGVALDSGSALDVLASTDILSAMDEEAILNNAEREAYGYKTEADISKATAGNITPLLSAASPLVSGVGQVSSQWYNYTKTGLL